MQGKGIKGVCKKLGDRKRSAVAWFKSKLEQLTNRQRLIIVLTAFVLFVVIDTIYIVRGFNGQASERIEIEHTRHIDLELIKPIEYDTEYE